jgi:hypothetical protein
MLEKRCSNSLRFLVPPGQEKTVAQLLADNTRLSKLVLFDEH